MKTLTEYINESLVTEAFASPILRNFWMGIPKSERLHTSRWNTLQWDKITDDDLIELTKDEALKRMRSKKNPGYLLWVDTNSPKQRRAWGEPGDSWEHPKYENFQYNGITNGYDIIMAWQYFRGMKAKDIADDATMAYEVKDPQRFYTNDMRIARRNAKEGALALEDPAKVREDNIRRYQNALAKMHTPDAKDLLPKLEEIAELYKNVMDKYVTTFSKKVQEDTQSYLDGAGLLTKLNTMFTSLVDKIKNVYDRRDSKAGDAWNSPMWAKQAYDEFNELVIKIEKFVDDYMAKVD